MLVGSHLSVAGGLHLAVPEAVRLGLDCVQVFTKNQRQWTAKPLAPEAIAAFRAAVKDAGWDTHPERRLVSHNSYLVNLASPDAESRRKSQAAQLDEVERCEALGIPSCVMHPGAHLGTARDAKDEAAGIARLAKGLDAIHAATRGYRTVTCIENTVGSGTNLGGPWDHLARIRDAVKDPERVAFCIDTCHATAWGHDMTTPVKAKAAWDALDAAVGLGSVRVIHVNDSKGAVGSHLDRHEHLGGGTCGEACFRSVARMKAFANVPCILETAKEGTLRGALPDLANAAWLRALACLVLCAGVTLATGGCRSWAKPESQVAKAEASIPADPTPEEAARIARAREIAQQGDYRQAMQDLGALVEQNPRLVEAKVAVADAARVQGDLRAAQRSYEATLAVAPDNLDARVGLAEVHEAAGRDPDAIRAYRQALLAHPADARAMAGVARCLERTGDFAGAVPFLERICADAAADADAWTRLGRAYLRTGRAADAVTACEEAVEMGEVQRDTMDALVSAYAASGRWSEAASSAEELARRWPDARASERAAYLCFRQGDMARAAAAYRTAAQQDPASVRAWNGVGACALNAWLLSDRLDGTAREEARRAFARSLELDAAQASVEKLVKQYRP